MVTIKDIAWAAGIYEGEGTFSSGKSARVTQKDPWLVYRLKDLFGGTISVHNGYYYWTVCGSDARGFLLSIFSFLSPRRRAQITEYKSFFVDEEYNRGGFCSKGHEMTPQNTKWVSGSTHTWKSCRICLTEKTRNKNKAKRLGISYSELMSRGVNA